METQFTHILDENRGKIVFYRFGVAGGPRSFVSLETMGSDTLIMTRGRTFFPMVAITHTHNSAAFCHDGRPRIFSFPLWLVVTRWK